MAATRRRQVVHFICVIVNSLTRSVSFHWPYAGQSEQPAAFSITCHCEKQITTSWQSLSIYESRSSTSVGALIVRPQGKVLYSYFFRQKGTIQRKFILGQHRIMGQGDSARDFGASESMKNAGILDVFPIFHTARLGQKIRRSPQLPLCGVALEFGTFSRAVNERPYEWMTIGRLEFDGDSHESSALLYRNDMEFGFTMTGNSAPRHCTTERYRAAQGRNDYTNLPHDLAVGPADKFQFFSLPHKDRLN